MKVQLTAQDLNLFSDISRFGFTTVEHFMLSLNRSYSAARHRFSDLVRNRFLKVAAISGETNKKIYVPDYRFYEFKPQSTVCKLNLFEIEHDEYLLKFYTLLEKTIGRIPVLAQDYKISGTYDNLLWVQDILLRGEVYNYYFEYFRALKSKYGYKNMVNTYQELDASKSIFIFICHNQRIANNVKENVNLKKIYFIKPQSILEVFKSQKYPHLLDYFENKDSQYFAEGNE